MKIALSILMTLVLSVALHGNARAELFYSVEFDRSADLFVPGQTKTVQVFLNEVFTDAADVPRLAPGGDGLLVANYQIGQTGPGDAAVVLAQPGFAGDPSSAAAGSPTRVINNIAIADSPVAGEANPAGGFRVGLGSVDIMAGSTIAPTVFQLAELDDTASIVDFLTGGGAVLDNQISFGSFTAVTAVPEPGSFALVGLAASGWWTRRRFRRKKNSGATN